MGVEELERLLVEMSKECFNEEAIRIELAMQSLDMQVTCPSPDIVGQSHVSPLFRWAEITRQSAELRMAEVLGQILENEVTIGSRHEDILELSR